jgi:hypothetical protein
MLIDVVVASKTTQNTLSFTERTFAMRAAHRFHRFAFTALQLVVVFGILLLGLALLVPAVEKVRDAAMRAQSMNNMKQLGLAMHNYHDAYKGLPPAVGELHGQNGPAHFHILPFVEEAGVFNGAEGASWKNQTYSKVLNLFLDPRDQTAPDHMYKNWLATTNYPVNWMVTKEGKVSLVQIADGTSNTLMFAQRYQMCNGEPTAWGYPAIHTWAPLFAYYSEGKFQSAPVQNSCDPRLAQSLGRDMMCALCDGSVRMVSPDIRPTTWYYLCDPSDGNPINDGAYD